MYTLQKIFLCIRKVSLFHLLNLSKHLVRKNVKKCKIKLKISTADLNERNEYTTMCVIMRLVISVQVT